MAKTVKRELYDAVNKQLDLFAAAFDYVQTRKPVAVEKLRKGDRRYTLSLYEPLAAHGGIVVQRHHHPGQRDDFRVSYFDDLRANAAVYPLDWRIAYERLDTERKRIYREAGLQ